MQSGFIEIIKRDVLIIQRVSDPMYILKTVDQSGLPLLVKTDKP